MALGMARCDGLEDLAAFGGETREKFRRILVPVARAAPAWSITVDHDAPLTGRGAFRGTVHDGIDKHERVAGLEISPRPRSRGRPFVLQAIRPCFGEFGMIEVCLMAARDDHCAAIPGADVSEREQNVHLAAAERPVDHTELIPDDTFLPAGVKRKKAPGIPHGCKAFIDKEAMHIRAILAAITLHAIDPGGVIDQILERRSRLNDILKFHAGEAIVIQPLHVAPPAAVLQVPGEFVESFIQFLQQRGNRPRS